MKRNDIASTKMDTKKILKKILQWTGIFLILWVIASFAFYIIYLRDIPSIDLLSKGNYFRESTIIYDKDKHPIYTLYTDGKRTYVDYNHISQYIKDAVVSTEDKTFFSNPGIDLKGLARAGIYYVLRKTDRISGTSTISQQLIKNTLLTNDPTLKRKVQEAYLSYKLNSEYTKGKILEMYLNAFSFGYNANGIEEASKTYFGKSAGEIGPLWASILASLPKWPTQFSPYNHRDRLMGKVYVYPTSDKDQEILLDSWDKRKEYMPLYSRFKSYLSGITIEWKWDRVSLCGIEEKYVRNVQFKPNSDGCISISHDEILPFFWDIIIKGNITSSGASEEYALEYNIGRKDFVAGRMFEDGKIDGKTFKKIIFDGLEFEFQKNLTDIKYPYFVMYIKEYLETKYGKDIDVTTGLKVYTTLDPKLQDKAEEILKHQVEINKKQYGASSAALISMDNKTGKLLAMVGWPDYNDEANGGKNNMVTATSLQPGSSFKPIVYSLAISKNPIGPESPIADVDTKFWGWHPSNYDGSFLWIMMLKNALDYSRNIPAGKMFYLAGWESEIVKFWKLLGLTTLKDNPPYWAPLALWSAQIRPIDLLQAYSVFANLWVKRDLYAIERIENADGQVLEEVKVPVEKEIFSPAASYIISRILSDNDARPESPFWRNALSIPGRIVAAKTGTSNKIMDKKWDKILPRDLWTIWYTPQITTVVWAGNVNGKETKWTCDGLNCAAAIWKWYMEFALKDLPKEDWKKPDWVYSFTIAKASGKLATETTPDEQKVSTIMAVKATEYDDGMKEVLIDTLCNGPVSENTPESSIVKIYIPSAKPIIDGYDPAWTEWFFQSLNKWGWSGGSIPAHSDTPCERPAWPGNVSISLQTVWINGDLSTEGKKIFETTWIGDRKIQKFVLKFGNEVRDSIDYGSWGKINGNQRTTMNVKSGDNSFTIELTDIYGFLYSESKTLKIWIGDFSQGQTGITPQITTLNPKEWDTHVNLYAWDSFNLRFSISLGTEIREISVLLDSTSIQNATAWDVFVIPVWTSGVSAGSHTLTIRLIDGNMHTVEKKIALTILSR